MLELESRVDMLTPDSDSSPSELCYVADRNLMSIVIPHYALLRHKQPLFCYTAPSVTFICTLIIAKSRPLHA